MDVVPKVNLPLERLRSLIVGSLAVNACKTNYIVFSRTGRLLNDNSNIFFGHIPIKNFLKLGIWGFI